MHPIQTPTTNPPPLPLIFFFFLQIYTIHVNDLFQGENGEFRRKVKLSPFGEIHRFHLEIGHSRESCRSVKKKIKARGVDS